MEIHKPHIPVLEVLELFLDLAALERHKAFMDFVCYGRTKFGAALDAAMSDAIHKRRDNGGWPTRDAAAPQEVC